MDYLAIAAAAVAQFIIGAIWYMPIFGTLWGKIHGFETNNSPEVQKQMQKQMPPLLAWQFFFTVVTTVVLSIFITNLPQSWNVYALAGFFWIGFTVPAQVSAVLFGGTEPKWVVQKILIMAGGSLVCLEVAVLILKTLA